MSAKTVSNVLGDDPYVRAETRERVMTAVRSLGYQMNFAVRNLRRGRTGMIMLALPELSLPYFAELADSVIDAASREGYTVLVERTGATRHGELDLLSGGRLRMVDGLIFSPLALGPDDADALRVDVAMVLLGERIFNGPVDHVTMANVDGGAAATRHLLSLGRRRIAVIGLHEGEAMGSAPLRLCGYAAALAETGLEPEPELMIAAGAWHHSTGAQAAHRLRRRNRRRRWVPGYLLIAPFFALFAVFGGYPLVVALQLSFTDLAWVGHSAVDRSGRLAKALRTFVILPYLTPWRPRRRRSSCCSTPTSE